MKRYFIVLSLLPFQSLGQWNNSGDNYSSGNLTVASVTTTSNYGFNLAPQDNGDAIIRRSNPGHLMISSNGGTSDVRFNYNYGGGSGGILIFDGGVLNHAGLKVNSNGHLTISSSGGFVGIGTSIPQERLHVEGNVYVGTNQVQFLSASGGNNRIQSFGGSGVSGTWLFKSRFDHMVFDAGESSGNERSIIFNTGGVERMRTDSYGRIGINKSNPVSKLDLNGDFQIYPSANAGSNGSLKLRVIPGVSASIIEANSDVVWADHDIIINAANSLSGNTNQLVVHRTGNVGIGTSIPSQKLTVNGTIYGKEVKVDLSVPGPDYVFEKNYNLPSLQEIKDFIDHHKHLPDVPSAADMKANGIELGVMNMLLLKKIEELTLYVIELKKENQKQDDVIRQLQNK